MLPKKPAVSQVMDYSVPSTVRLCSRINSNVLFVDETLIHVPGLTVVILFSKRILFTTVTMF